MIDILEGFVSVDDVKIYAVEAGGNYFSQVAVLPCGDDALPIGVPILERVVAGPVRVFVEEPRWWGGMILVFPIVAVVLGFANAKVANQQTSAAVWFIAKLRQVVFGQDLLKVGVDDQHVVVCF